jgi:phage/plasmid-associated DNA primase
MRPLNSARAAAAETAIDPRTRDRLGLQTQDDAETEQIIAASEDALALRFAERHGSTLRYVAAWGRWLAWDGRRWCFDSTLDAFDRVRRICREAASEANEPRVQTALAWRTKPWRTAWSAERKFQGRALDR